MSCSARPRWCARRRPASRSMAEDRRRQPPYRARDAVAVKVERRAIGRNDWAAKIHFHAVDDCMEILPLDREAREMRRQAAAFAVRVRRGRAHRCRCAMRPFRRADRRLGAPAANRRRRHRPQPGRSRTPRTSPRAFHAARCACQRKTMSPKRRAKAMASRLSGALTRRSG